MIRPEAAAVAAAWKVIEAEEAWQVEETRLNVAAARRLFAARCVPGALYSGPITAEDVAAERGVSVEQAAIGRHVPAGPGGDL